MQFFVAFKVRFLYQFLLPFTLPLHCTLLHMQHIEMQQNRYDNEELKIFVHVQLSFPEK